MPEPAGYNVEVISELFAPGNVNASGSPSLTLIAGVLNSAKTGFASSNSYNFTSLNRSQVLANANGLQIRARSLPVNRALQKLQVNWVKS